MANVEGEKALTLTSFPSVPVFFLRYTALANVKKMRELLNDDIDMVGVGGVRTGTDAFEMILCGASAVQMATTHWNEGATCFARVASELGEIMKRKGYVDFTRGLEGE